MDQRGCSVPKYQYSYEEFSEQAKGERIYYKRKNQDKRVANTQQIEIYRRLRRQQEQLKERYPYNFSDAHETNDKFRLFKNNVTVRFLLPNEIQMYKRDKSKQALLNQTKEAMKKIDIESVWINEAGFGVIKIGGFDQYLTKTQTAFFKLLTTKTGTTLEEFRHFYKILEIKELYKGQRKYEILHNGKFIRALTAEETEQFLNNEKKISSERLSSDQNNINSNHFNLSDDESPRFSQNRPKKEENILSPIQITESKLKSGKQHQLNKSYNNLTSERSEGNLQQLKSAKSNQEMLKSYLKEIEQVKQRNSVLESQNSRLRVQMKNMDQSSKQKEDKFRTNEQIIQSFQKESQKQKTRIEQLQGEIEQLKSQLKSERKQYEQLSEQFKIFKDKSQNTIQKDEFDDMKSRYETEKSQNMTLTQQITTYPAQIRSLEAQLASKTKECQLRQYFTDIILPQFRQMKIQQCQITSLLKSKTKLELNDKSKKQRHYDFHEIDRQKLEKSELLGQLYKEVIQLKKRVQQKERNILRVLAPQQQSFKHLIDAFKGLKADKSASIHEVLTEKHNNNSQQLLDQLSSHKKRLYSQQQQARKQLQLKQNEITELLLTVSEQQQRIVELERRCEQNDQYIKKLRQNKSSSRTSTNKQGKIKQDSISD